VRSGVIDKQAHRDDRRRHGDHEIDVQAPAPGQNLRERTATTRCASDQRFRRLS
jgi:hypothetical protein